MERIKLSKQDMKMFMGAGDLPDYINRKQIAIACNVAYRSTDSWIFPDHDLKISNKRYWLSATITDFINNYNRLKRKK